MTALLRGGPPERAARPRTAGSQVTRQLRRLPRHWLAAMLLTAGLALRILVMLAYRPALFFIDSARYLYSAQGNDPAGYRVPLRGILLVGNLQTVVAVQHLLGLAMAVALYAVLVRRGTARWLAAIAIAPVLLDAYQLQMEQTIMPDVWFEALIVAGLAALLWKPVLSTGSCVAGGIILGSCATVRQVGEILVVPAVIFVIAAAGGWRQAIRKSIAVCIAFAVPILAYCTVSYAVTGHFWLAHAGVTTTYGRMAAAADCAALRLTQQEQPLCPTPSQRALGPDGLEHSPQSPLRPYYASLQHANASRLVSGFDTAVLTQQPLRVLAGIAGDAARLFAVTRSTSPGDTPVSRWQFQAYYPAFAPHATRAEIRGFIAQFGGGQPAVSRPLATVLRSYQLDGGYTPGPLLLLATVAGMTGSAAVLRRDDGAGRRQLAAACLLFTATAAAVLLVSDAFEFSWRYQLPALVLLPAAGALGLSVLGRLARRRIGGSAAGPAAAPDSAGP